MTPRVRYRPPVEVVERKGLGHPDTICDHIAESLSRRLAELCLARTGSVQPFNVDKGLLLAGAAKVGFGGGYHVAPARLIVAGRADPVRHGVGIAQLRVALRDDLAALVPAARPEAFEVDLQLRPTSPELATLGSPGPSGVPLANDTSVAVVSLPRSMLEELVHQATVLLNSADVRERLPVGTDVKVMGARAAGHVELTVAAAVLAERVPTKRAYTEVIEAVRHEVSSLAHDLVGGPVDVAVNPAAAAGPYLTLSGSSAEMGDDGQVGRGNRFGGLITPCRPMSMEACAGKNPAAHVGKTYHCVAHDIASQVLARTDAAEVTVTVLSRIGEPVTHPALVHVETFPEPDADGVRAIVSECVADWRGVQDRVLARHYELF